MSTPEPSCPNSVIEAKCGPIVEIHTHDDISKFPPALLSAFKEMINLATVSKPPEPVHARYPVAKKYLKETMELLEMSAGNGTPMELLIELAEDQVKRMRIETKIKATMCHQVPVHNIDCSKCGRAMDFDGFKAKTEYEESAVGKAALMFSCAGCKIYINMFCYGQDEFSGIF